MPTALILTYHTITGGRRLEEAVAEVALLAERGTSTSAELASCRNRLSTAEAALAAQAEAAQEVAANHATELTQLTDQFEVSALSRKALLPLYVRRL